MLDLDAWLPAARLGPVGVVTVADISGSAPRDPGATMVVTADGAVIGSVSGGCVEGAVYDVALEVIATGVPQRITFVSRDEPSFDIALTCGGAVELFIQRVGPDELPEWEAVAEDVRVHRPRWLATIVEHPDEAMRGRMIPSAVGLDPGLVEHVAQDAAALASGGRGGLLRYGVDGHRMATEVTVLVRTWTPAPRMVIVGAADHARALAASAQLVGYRVTVVDPRPVFATVPRFPGSEVIVGWPDRYLAAELEAGRIDGRGVVCVLSHDERVDVPTLAVALEADLAYVGAMGSRRTDSERRAALDALGLAVEALARLHSPIGLDLGARTPEETAVSILAEIIAERSQRAGEQLRTTRGAIRGDQDGASTSAPLARSPHSTRVAPNAVR